MWFLHDGTGWTLYCLSHGELAWHFQNHIQGWMNDLNMLLSCSGMTMPAVSHLPPQSTLSRKTLFESASLAYCSTLTDIRDILTGQGSGLKIVTFQPSRFKTPFSVPMKLPWDPSNVVCPLRQVGASSASFMKFGTRRRGSVQGLRLEDLSW